MSWRACKLGDVIKLQRGHDLPNDARRPGEVPVVSSSGITGYHDQAKAKPPGVVTGRYGTLGEVFFVDVDYWPLNTALYVVDFKGTDPRFAAYFLRSVLKDYQSDKAAVPGVDRNVLHELNVRVPDLKTQLEIASILAAYDDLIENNADRMALLEHSARMLYEEWFVRLRFPGREHTCIIGGLPQGWAKRRLDAVAEVNRASLSGNFDGEIEYIDIASVTPGQINQTTAFNFRDAPSRARRIVQHGDIIWSCVRPNRRSHAVIWRPAPNLIASTGFAVISPKMVPTSYLYQAVTTNYFAGYLENRARGAAYPAVVAGDFGDAALLVPPSAMLKTYDDFARPILDQLHVLRSQNRRLREARDLLLPRLMSGEVTV